MIRPTVVSLLVAALFTGCSGDLRELNRCYALGKALCGAYRVAPDDSCIDQINAACISANSDGTLDASDINDCVDKAREISGDDFDRCLGTPPDACVRPMYELRDSFSGSSYDSSGSNSCVYSYDGTCDEPSYCSYGTDSADCGSSGSGSSEGPSSYVSGCLEGRSDLSLGELFSECESGNCVAATSGLPTASNDSCEFANNGSCDEGDLCAPGTDASDCF